MFDKAIQFLKDHKEIALATCEGNLDYVECCHDSDIPERAQMSLAASAFPKLRIFQIMKQEGHVLYFATSAEKAVWRELQQNPNVELLAYADNVSVRCSGMVNFDMEDDVRQCINSK